MPEVPDTVDDALEPLVSPSTDEVFEATRPFSAREIGSAAVSEALSGGGGGGSLQVIGPLTVPFDDPGVNSTYTTLAGVAAGTSVIKVWAIDQGFLTAPDGESIEVTVDVQEVGGGSLMEVYRVNQVSFVVNSTRELTEFLTPTDPPRTHAAIVPDSGSWELAAYIFVNGDDTPSAGALDFYALVNLPE